MTLSVDGKISSPKSPNGIRLVSFNINGYKTLNHYHPWNELSTLQQIFNYLKADIITFQELKLQKQDIDRSIAVIKGYHSFISIPKSKKGYSGVGVFVTSTRSDLQVLKVEEGISGYLELSTDPKLTYRKIWDAAADPNSSLAIGGYTDNFNDWKEGYRLDQDGRCVIIELNNNIVIISVYCPANSMGEEEEETSRCLFLETLFKRAENLEKMGKHVLIMGDINVAPSLIDRDDYINIGLREKTLSMPPKDSGQWFEKMNKDQTLNFRSEILSRKILNDYLFDYNGFVESKNTGKILYDLGRFKNLNRLKMYTCWNTLKNNRPLNIGSRIDLFLATKSLQAILMDSDIWQFLYGSDHCPIYADLDISKLPKNETITVKPKIRHFEAVNYYDLTITKSIDSFFRSKSIPKVTTKINATENTPLKPESITINKRSSTIPLYTSRKKQKGQSTLPGLITKEKEVNNHLINSKSSLFVQDSDEEDDESTNGQPPPEQQQQQVPILSDSTTKQPKLSANAFNQLLTMKSFNSVPQCQHQEPCVLRTTKKGNNAGRKFWCCARPSPNSTWSETGKDSEKKDTDENAYSCSYFKWAQK